METQGAAPAKLLINYQEITDLLMRDYQLKKWLKCNHRELVLVIQTSINQRLVPGMSHHETVMLN